MHGHTQKGLKPDRQLGPAMTRCRDVRSRVAVHSAWPNAVAATPAHGMHQLFAHRRWCCHDQVVQSSTNTASTSTATLGDRCGRPSRFRLVLGGCVCSLQATRRQICPGVPASRIEPATHCTVIVLIHEILRPLHSHLTLATGFRCSSRRDESARGPALFAPHRHVVAGAEAASERAVEALAALLVRDNCLGVSALFGPFLGEAQMASTPTCPTAVAVVVAIVTTVADNALSTRHTQVYQ